MITRFSAAFVVLGSLAILTSPAAAHDYLYRGRYAYPYGSAARNHARHHDDLAHREFHRELRHREAHRYPMTHRQHERLHDQLDHERFHDWLEHREAHRSGAYYRHHHPGYGSFYHRPHSGFGYRGRNFSFYFGR
jgi:hypothetical protein